MDVEGTTTSIDFVHDTLFPYAYDKMESFIKANPELVSGLDNPTATLKQWIKEDKKEPLLKTIQGHIWKEGYESGELKGHLYDDVPAAFKRWKQDGLGLGIYSSGSVLAQKLLFTYSKFGDQDQLIEANFDTKIGHKREKQSYTNILNDLNLSGDEVLFLSDISEELAAASESGMHVIQLIRKDPVNSPFDQIRSFDEI